MSYFMLPLLYCIYYNIKMKIYLYLISKNLFTITLFFYVFYFYKIVESIHI